MENKNKIEVPTVADLFKHDLQKAFENEQLNLLLCQPPHQKWVKEHPHIKGHLYIPIDKVEYMLRRIFKRYRIEVTGQGQSFNGVWVTVRVHYWNPVFNDWDFHDGIGAAQLQTKAGTDATDFKNINRGAIAMAYPLAKTTAIKDACDHFGDVFGANLNRKDVVGFNADESLNPNKNKAPVMENEMFEEIGRLESIKDLDKYVESHPEFANNPIFKQEIIKQRKNINAK